MTPGVSADRAAGESTAGPRVTASLCGDVMLGRGMDQVMPSSVDLRLHEPSVRDARRYVELAEAASGPIPAPVGPAYPWGAALETLERAAPDLRIVNLETAITLSDEPDPGKSIHYRTHPDNVAVLEAADVDACVLANNHVLDWGREGLEETLETLEGARIEAVGAGRNDGEARAPARLRAGGTRVLLFGRAAVDAGVPRAWAAERERPGVALLPDPSEAAAGRLAARIREHRAPDDVVVVSLHWGGNWGYRIPDRHRRFARVLIDEAGVDLVHGHSSHHPKGLGVYRGTPILYGCGDFLTDYEGIGGHEEFRPGLSLLYRAALAPGDGEARLSIRPFRLRRFRLEAATGEEAAWLRETLDRESRPLGARVRAGGEGTLEVSAATGGRASDVGDRGLSTR